MQLHNMSEGPRRRYETTDDDLTELIDNNDLSALTKEQRKRYYLDVCREHGLNPRLKPLMWLRTRDGRLVLYCLKSGAEQLRRMNHVSLTIASSELVGEYYIVRTIATAQDGREEHDEGIVNLRGMRGQDRANAMMAAVTKSKRRATLSLCAVGLLDESEVADMDGATSLGYNVATGDLTPAELAESLTTGKEPVVTSEQIGCFWAIVRDLQWSEPEWKALLARHGYTKPNEVGRFREFDVIKAELSDIVVRNGIREELGGSEVAE